MNLAELASRAGMPLLDFDGFYGAYPKDSLRLSGTDPHLNVLGHKVVAEHLYKALQKSDA